MHFQRHMVLCEAWVPKHGPYEDLWAEPVISFGKVFVWVFAKVLGGKQKILFELFRFEPNTQSLNPPRVRQHQLMTPPQNPRMKKKKTLVTTHTRAPCVKHGCNCAWHRADAHLAGPPCVSWSPMGCKEGAQAADFKHFLAWISMRRQHKEYVTNMEEVSHQPFVGPGQTFCYNLHWALTSDAFFNHTIPASTQAVNNMLNVWMRNLFLTVFTSADDLLPKPLGFIDRIRFQSTRLSFWTSCWATSTSERASSWTRGIRDGPFVANAGTQFFCFESCVLMDVRLTRHVCW